MDVHVLSGDMDGGDSQPVNPYKKTQTGFIVALAASLLLTYFILRTPKRVKRVRRVSR